MSVWRYCDSCGEGMDRPTLTDFILGKMECYHCDHPHVVGEFERRLEVDQLIARVGAIESVLGITQ